MKKLFKYLKYSGIWVTFVFNPFHWRFEPFPLQRSPFSSQNYELFFSFWFVNLHICVDDGTDWDEQVDIRIRQ